jgi:stage V sporulation protein R
VSVDLDELKRWDDEIVKLVDAYGLDCFQQEFEICDHNEMMGYMAYSGMPSHYPHWSYGKSFEKLNLSNRMPTA